MKIMWLNPHLTVPTGGTRYIFEATKRLSKNHDVTIYVQKSNPDILTQFKENSIKVITIGKYSTGDFLFWLNFKKNLNNEINFLKKEARDFDVVVSSMFPMNIEANSLGLPHLQCCFQPYAFFWDSLMIKKLPLTHRLFLRCCKSRFGKLDIEATKKSNIVITVIADVQNWIKKIYKRDSIVAHAGVDIDFFKNIYNKDLHQKYFGKKIILHSTDWTPLKRTNWLIDQFYKINLKIENCVLLILEVKNSGSEKNLALKKIKEKKLRDVELCGFIPEKLLPAYYSLADVVVYPGIGEGASSASYVVLESLACETPVVRTDEGKDE